VSPTLTRGEALDAIDAALSARLPKDEVLDLQGLWIGHRQHLHEDTAETLAERLREYVAACCTSDDERSNGPSDSDDTGIPS
jgi:hypothetical protein